MADADLAPLVAKLEARTRDFDKALEKANRKLDGSTRDMNRSWNRGMAKLERRAKKMGGAVAKFLVFTPIIATAGIVAATQDALSYAKELRNLSNVAGTTASRLQEIGYASAHPFARWAEPRKS